MSQSHSPAYLRITGPENAVKVTVGKVYRVIRIDDHDGRPTIINDKGEEWACALPGELIYPVWPRWEAVEDPMREIARAAKALAAAVANYEAIMGPING